MTLPDIEAIRIQQALERIRQERETFDQLKRHDGRWFFLTLCMGYAAIVLLAAILAVSGYVLLNHDVYSRAVEVSAAGALFADGLGLMVSVWGIVIRSGSPGGQVQPVTNAPDLSDQRPGQARSV